MNSLYKYLPIKFAEKMINENSLKIGTLYSYRDVENYGDEIGDSDEGKRTEYSHDKEPKRGDQLNPLESAAINVGAGMIVENNYVERQHHSENVYLYCLSRTYKTTTLEKLNKDFPGEKYDACVEIFEPDKFISAINASFGHKGENIGSFDCCYINRKQHYTVKMPHPALIKDPKYSYQEEQRIIWHPLHKDELKEEIIIVNGISSFCKLC